MRALYRVQIVRGQINRVIKPQDGWVSTLTTFGDHYYDFNIRTYTHSVKVNASTKDNAAVAVEISLTVLPPNDDESIKAYIRKFGLEEEERKTRMTQILKANTETKNAGPATKHTGCWPARRPFRAPDRLADLKATTAAHAGIHSNHRQARFP